VEARCVCIPRSSAGHHAAPGGARLAPACYVSAGVAEEVGSAALGCGPWFGEMTCESKSPVAASKVWMKVMFPASRVSVRPRRQHLHLAG
jgi:hypothetical protein